MRKTEYINNIAVRPYGVVNPHLLHLTSQLYPLRAPAGRLFFAARLGLHRFCGLRQIEYEREGEHH